MNDFMVIDPMQLVTVAIVTVGFPVINAYRHIYDSLNHIIGDGVAGAVRFLVVGTTVK